MPAGFFLTPKSRSPAKNATKPSKAKPKPPPKKAATPKKTPAPAAAPASKWRAAPAAAPQPPEPPASESAAPAQPSRALMVIPQPPEQTPWQRFVADPDGLERLCTHVIEGGHMSGFCKERGINYTSLLKWVNADPHRSEMYARAREDRADMLADEIVSIADETEVVAMYKGEQVVLALDSVAVQRNRNRFEARKWAASKLKPRVYSDKVQVEQTVNHREIPDSELLQRLARLGVTLPSIVPQPPSQEGEGA